MSTLQVANIHLESTGNNRLQYTGSNSASLVIAGANAISITSTGTVGIGNSSPDQKLVVAGSIRIADYGAIGPVSNTTGMVIHGGNNISGNPLQSGIIFRGNTGGAGGTASNGLELYANGVQYMRVEGGNVSIVSTNNFYVGTASAVANNGYSYLPNGILLQWGTVAANTSVGNVTFPIAYTTVFQGLATSGLTGFYAYVAGVNSSVIQVRSSQAVAATNQTIWWSIGLK